MIDFYKNSRIKPMLFIAIFLVSIFYTSMILNNNLLNSFDNKSQKHDKDFDNSNLAIELNLNAGEESLLFEGTEIPLNITDYGNLYKYNQKVSLNNQDPYNMTYYLDDEHGWEISEIQTVFKNIQDTREWVADKDFLPQTLQVNDTLTFRNRDPSGNPYHNYSNNLINDPDDPHNTIIQNDAIAMRAHFSIMDIEDSYDCIFIYDENNTLYYTDTGYRTDFYSPWILGSKLKVTMASDSSITRWGYDINFFEYYNESSQYYANLNNWDFNSNNFERNFGPGTIRNSTSMYVVLYAVPYQAGSPLEWAASYSKNDYSEIFQNLIIQRGNVIDAYISFDYYAEFAMESNENYIYCEINDKKIYSKGLGDIVEAGKHQWHSTGKINIDLWINNSKIFDPILSTQDLNISVGIKSGASVGYYGFEDRFQQIIWFDNISLVLTSIANSTQNDINLTLKTNSNNYNLFDFSEWGNSYLNLSENWNQDPITLTFNSTSPSLTFDINATLYGYHDTYSKTGQTINEGTLYKILNNGSIYWEFYHNLYMPSQYSDFEFKIYKPSNWEIISVLDPTFLPIYFEGGNLGDNYLKVSNNYAQYPGWWKITATSPNYIDEKNTDLSKLGEWGYGEFYSGESTIVKTQINYSNEIPSNLDQTTVNLKVYYPNGSLWLDESKVPFSNGTVIFSEIIFTSSSSVGGIYNYTLFWSNGTALGGISSNFVVIHDSYITLLEPDDAKDDNRTGGSAGDIIPLRIYLRDAENDLYISGASVSYNWTTGTEHLVEVATGIYDAILDTAYLGGYGLYRIIITTNKIGFINSNLTLEINLGEDSVLQRLESDSKIIIHENSTIRFRYYSDFDEEGIDDASISVNISDPKYYNIQYLSNGLYSIEFNTDFFNTTGIYQLYFEFSADGFEPQIHLYKFEIINPPQQGSQPNYLLWVFLAGAIIVSAILASLSFRSYVILPRRRRKESELLSETQRFKDIRNIQAIVIIHKLSGIPLYSKSYSILEKHKKELFSGFIQAITTIGEEFSEEGKKYEEKKIFEKYGTEKIIELDFKYFYCVIADLEEVRVVLVLREKSSERLRNQTKHLLLALSLNLTQQLENWDGSLDQFENLVPPIINDYFELYYKEAFKLNIRDFDYIKMKKEKGFTKLEIRVINVIESVSNTKDNIINLDTIINLVHEENKDLIIKAIESLIEQKIIVPINI